MKERLSKK